MRSRSFEYGAPMAMVWLIVLCAPLAAGAQQADADASQPPATAQGPMMVERVHNGFAVAPNFKVSRFDRRGRILPHEQFTRAQNGIWRRGDRMAC